MDAVRKKMTALKLKLDESEAAAEKVEDELAVINKRTAALEEENLEMTKEIQQIEDDLDETESRLTTLLAQFDKARKSADESSHARRMLQNRGETDSERIARLSRDLKDYREQSQHAADRFLEVSELLAEDEDALDEEEERLEKFTARVRVLETEVTQVGNTLRSLEMSEEISSKRTDKGDSKIEALTQRLEDEESAAINFEERAAEYEKELGPLEDQLQEVKDLFQKRKVEFDDMLAEIREM